MPVQKRDGELDWASYAGPGALAAGPHDIAEPTGDRLGPEAIAAAEVIVVPALAVDQAGHRLGQGGGGYDRALTRSAPGVLTVAALHDDEFLDDIPTEPHDISVLAAATPTRLIRCRE